MWLYVKYEKLLRNCLNADGVVMLMTLLFLQILTLLGLFAVQNSIVAGKISRSQWLQVRLFETAERELQQAEVKVLENVPRCLIPTMTTSKLILRPLTFWQSSASCKGTFRLFQYYYVVEELGEDVCADVTDVKYQKMMADYFRITLLVYSETNQAQKILQSTLVRPVKSANLCKKVHHQVHSGRQMWREV